MRARFRLPVLSLAVLAAAAACSSSGGGGVAVTSSDTACDVETTKFDAGKVTLDVKNDGGDVTEVYVYGPDDEVKGEVENIGPGTTRSFTVDLVAGEYEVACKPGMKGDGIRTPIAVTGDGGAEVGAANRTVLVDAVDYEFQGIAEQSFESGQVVEFQMHNAAASEEHEFEVFSPKGKVMGEVGPTKPGKTGRVVIELDEPGRYRVVCGIDDHEAKGMVSSFTVH